MWNSLNNSAPSLGDPGQKIFLASSQLCDHRLKCAIIAQQMELAHRGRETLLGERNS
jgi:hypothetical protein